MSESDGPPPPPSNVTWKGTDYLPLADGKYDVIILGTGMKECILSGLLSKDGKKVLHLDRNGHYGGECASLNLTNLYKKFVDKSAEAPPKAFMDALGSNRDYNVDLIPKFLMANGNLVKMLVATDMPRYLEFKPVDGSFVAKKDQSVHKVPATLEEAVKTSLVSFLQKKWLHSFLKYIAGYDQANPSTWDGKDLSKMTMKELFDKMWFDKDTGDFVGHAMGLQPDDSYLTRPALETIKSLRLYAESLDRYADMKSPFLYPLYGLGGIPEGFSRLCALHGGTFILNKACDEILLNEDGTAAGVRSGSGAEAEVALAPTIIGDPSYFPASMIRQTGKIIRSICIINHAVKGLEADVQSAQIIIPQSQAGRSNDIYVSIVGNSHQVTGKGKYAAIISTVVETDKPGDEVKFGVALLGELLTKFDNTTSTFEPVEDGSKSRVFITKSYDASSHFEAATEEVLQLYTRISGKVFDLSIKAEVEVSQ